MPLVAVLAFEVFSALTPDQLFLGLPGPLQIFFLRMSPYQMLDHGRGVTEPHLAVEAPVQVQQIRREA